MTFGGADPFDATGRAGSRSRRTVRSWTTWRRASWRPWRICQSRGPASRHPPDPHPARRPRRGRRLAGRQRRQGLAAAADPAAGRPGRGRAAVRAGRPGPGPAARHLAPPAVRTGPDRRRSRRPPADLHPRRPGGAGDGQGRVGLPRQPAGSRRSRPRASSTAWPTATWPSTGRSRPASWKAVLAAWPSAPRRPGPDRRRRPPRRCCCAPGQALDRASAAEVLVAAGSTGTAPATADLLRVIAAARWARSCCRASTRAWPTSAWDKVGEQHPQGAMRRLLDRAGSPAAMSALVSRDRQPGPLAPADRQRGPAPGRGHRRLAGPDREPARRGPRPRPRRRGPEGPVGDLGPHRGRGRQRLRACCCARPWRRRARPPPWSPPTRPWPAGSTPACCAGA
jgi:hypothetical protein